MAIINCHECNQKISDAAEVCPKCGAPSANKKVKIPLYFISLIWFVGFLLFVYSIGALVVSLMNRQCKYFFTNNMNERYWSCVGDYLSDYQAVLIGLIAMITMVIATLLINWLNSK